MLCDLPPLEALISQAAKILTLPAPSRLVPGGKHGHLKIIAEKSREWRMASLIKKKKKNGGLIQAFCRFALVRIVSGRVIPKKGVE